MGKQHIVHICDNTAVPGERECLAAIHSRGRDCKTCDRSDCYRQGWSVDEVTADNARRVQAKHAGEEPDDG